MLTQALEAIAAQLKDQPWNDQIEVIVCDNASSDETEQAVKKIMDASAISRLTYFRQPENLGYDTNVYTAVQKAIGIFVYIVSDDDVLLPGALQKLMRLMKEYPRSDAFCLNTYSFESDPLRMGRTRFTIAEDQVIPSADECLRFLGTWLTFISAIAFRRELIAGKDYIDRIGTIFIQSYCFLDVLIARPDKIPDMIVTSQPFLAVRTDNVGSFHFFQGFVTNFRSLLDYAKQCGYSKSDIEQVWHRHLRRFVFPFICDFRMKGSFGELRFDCRDGLKRLLHGYPTDPFLFFAVIPSLLLPAPLILQARNIYRTLKASKGAHE